MKVRIYNSQTDQKRVEKAAPLFNGLRLKYTRHAEEAAKNDRYGNVAKSLPKTIDLRTFETVEVEEDNGVVVKAIVRNAVSVDLDVVLAVLRDGTVKTVWLNKADDGHKTLNRSRLNK